MRHFGLSADYSAEYLPHWQATPKALMALLKTITGASRNIIHAAEKKLELQRTVDQLEEISRNNLAPEKAVEEVPVKAGREFLISERMILIAAFVAGDKEKIVSRLKSEALMEKARAVSVSR